MPDQQVQESQAPNAQNAPAPSVPEPDPYDLGDTGMVPQDTLPASQAAPVKVQQPEQEEPQQPADTRPRNADGTFRAIHNHSAAVVEAARDFGWTDEEITDTPPDKMHRIVISQLKAQNALRTQLETERTLERNAVRTPQPEPQQKRSSQESQEPQGENDELKEVLDPRLFNAIEDLRKENKSLRSKLGEFDELKQTVQNSRKATVNDVIDSAFDEIARPDVFGDGGINDLLDGSDEVMFRHSVLNAAKVEDGDTPAAIKRKVTSAAKRFAAKIQPPQPQRQQPVAPNRPIASKPTISGYSPQPSTSGNGDGNSNGNGRPSRQEWEQAGLHKPTARSSEELPSGTERAVRNMARKYFGQENPVQDSEEMDGFLPQ